MSSEQKFYLTVGELIDALAKLPREKRIAIDDADTGWFLKVEAPLRVDGKYVLLESEYGEDWEP